MNHSLREGDLPPSADCFSVIFIYLIMIGQGSITKTHSANDCYRKNPIYNFCQYGTPPTKY